MSKNIQISIPPLDGTKAKILLSDFKKQKERICGALAGKTPKLLYGDMEVYLLGGKQ